MGIIGYHSSKTAHGIERRRSCSDAKLSQEVWVSLRLCISKKLQERQVLLALASPSESEGRRSQQENGGSLGVRGAVFKKILHKKRKKCRKLIFLYIIAWCTK